MNTRPYSFPIKLAAVVLFSSAIATAAANVACGASSSTSPTTSTTTTTAPANSSTMTVSTTAVTFAPNVTAGATQPVTLTNSGSVPVVMTSVTAIGNFSESNDCGASIAVGASCTVTVMFVPQAPGSAGLLTITDDAGTSPQTVTLTGPTVLAPSAVLSPSTLDFGPLAVGTTSAPQTVTLTNPVNSISVALVTTTSSITGNDFAVSQNGCQQPISPGASCTISLTFAPSVAGSRAALFAIFDNAATPTQSVTLRGSGQ